MGNTLSFTTNNYTAKLKAQTNLFHTVINVIRLAGAIVERLPWMFKHARNHYSFQCNVSPIMGSISHDGENVALKWCDICWHAGSPKVIIPPCLTIQIQVQPLNRSSTHYQLNPTSAISPGTSVYNVLVSQRPCAYPHLPLHSSHSAYRLVHPPPLQQRRMAPSTVGRCAVEEQDQVYREESHGWAPVCACVCRRRRCVWTIHHTVS